MVAFVLLGRRYVGSFRVEDASAGGAILYGEARLRRGDRIEVILLFAHHGRIALEAEVVEDRAVGSGEHAFAVRRAA